MGLIGLEEDMILRVDIEETRDSVNVSFHDHVIGYGVSEDFEHVCLA